MNWLVLAGSLAAVFTVAGIAWLGGMGGAPGIENTDHAMRLARDAHSGFAPSEAAVDSTGRAALVQGKSGEIVLLRAHGARFAARVFKAHPGVRREGGRLSIATGERMFGDAVLELGDDDAALWARRLQGAADA